MWYQGVVMLVMEKGMATHSSLLAWRIHGSLVGCCPWGHTEFDMTEVTYLACMHAYVRDRPTALSETVQWT